VTWWRSPTSIERISRRPVSWTPCAITSALLTTRPPSRTFSTLASSHSYGYRPGPERLHVLIESAADPAHLVLADPQAEALDELVDAPRRDDADGRLAVAV
jgi:hypothetical protein